MRCGLPRLIELFNRLEVPAATAINASVIDAYPALAEAILVTPTVIKLSPAPEVQIIGNLNEEEEVLRALGLPQTEQS